MTPDATARHAATDGAAAPAYPLVEDFLTRYEQGPGALDEFAGVPEIDLAPTLDHMRVLERSFTVATIDDFLPETLYQDILRDWPAAEAFAAVTGLPGAASTAYIGERRQRIVDNSLAGDGLSGATWLRLRLALRHPRFVRGLFTCFADTVERNLATLDLSSLDTTNFKLYANLDAGVSDALGAHVDALPKLLTIVVYLDLKGAVTPDSATRWGTALYSAQPGAVRPLTFTSNADHQAVHQLDFAPNRAFVMPNAPHALHGVLGGEPGVERRTLMCGYWLTQPPAPAAS
ncbi:hypothetical protein [Streptosporangium sp. KLBMP 9127]|nr:hypothetical protein [Streptosporangium sp. KLBMP 9127]